MWDKFGFILAIIGTVIGGIALCYIVASVMYFTIFWAAPVVGRGHVAHWDDVFPVNIVGGGQVKNAPRVVIRGERIDGDCRFYIGLSGSGRVPSIRARTIWQDHDTCETEIEIRAKLIQAEARH